jgi:hypothetical protein
VDLIPKVYSAPRVVRVLGPDGQASLAPLNQPFQADIAEAQGQARKIEKIYDLTVGKYDVTVSAGPSFTSRREEAATQMIELIRAYPPSAPIIGDLLARNLDWPGADQIAERLAALLPAEVKQPSPELEAAQAQIARLTQALQSVGGKLAGLEQNKALEARRLEIEAFEAETNRMKLTGGATQA